MSTAPGIRRLLFVLAIIVVSLGMAGAALAAQSSEGRSRLNNAADSTQKPYELLTDTPTETVVVTRTATPTETPQPCAVVINGAITAGDPQQANRLRRDGVSSTCAVPKTCPGVLAPGSLNFDSYTYRNTTGSQLCITVRLDDSGCGENHDIFSVTYLNSYDPANVCANYLADGGGTPAPINSYSFNVPAGATFVIVVHEVYPGTGCPLYNLRVTGLPCELTPTPTGSASVTTTPTGSVSPTATSQASATVTGTPCSITFTDVHPTDYFYEPVRYLFCLGAISGYGDNTFRPFANTTRGQLSKIVALAEGWTIVTPTGTPTFRDVAADNPFYAYIETAYSHNVISGYSCGTGCLEFRPNNNVTRAQLTKIIVLAQNWEVTPPSTPTFRDVPSTDAFYGYIETAYSHNIISGYSCGGTCLEFRPGANATRGQIAKIVYNAVAGTPNR